MGEIAVLPVIVCLLPGIGHPTILLRFFLILSVLYLFLDLPLHVLKHLDFLKTECAFLPLTSYFLFKGLAFFESALLKDQRLELFSALILDGTLKASQIVSVVSNSHLERLTLRFKMFERWKHLIFWNYALFQKVVFNLSLEFPGSNKHIIALLYHPYLILFILWQKSFVDRNHLIVERRVKLLERHTNVHRLLDNIFDLRVFLWRFILFSDYICGFSHISGSWCETLGCLVRAVPKPLKITYAIWILRENGFTRRLRFLLILRT